MIVKDMFGREVEIETSGQYSDDIQIDAAYYVDTGDDVSDEVMQYIYDNYSEELSESWLEHLIGKAEYYE